MSVLTTEHPHLRRGPTRAYTALHRVVPSSAKGLLIAAGLLCAYAPATADNPLHQAQAVLDEVGRSFVAQPDYIALDVDSLTNDSYYSPANFPGAPNAHASIALPDADLDPVTRAVLLLDSHEPKLPHVRYRITYSMNVSSDFPEVRQDYVEVRRYNLGPARRADLESSVPENQLADADEFGVGPHVSWRVVTSPLMGQGAALRYAGRKEIPDIDAQTDDCLGAPCLALAGPNGPDLDWQPVPSPAVAPANYAVRSNWGLATPVRVMHELWSSITGQGMDPLPYEPKRPAFEIVISLNTDGQQAAVLGLAKQARVMDATVSEIWTQRFEAEQTTPEFSTLLVPRK